MPSYYDEKKKKVIVREDGESKEFSKSPSLMDRLKEGFQPTSTRAELEVIRKRRQGNG